MNTAIATVGHNSGIPAYNEYRDMLASLRQENAGAIFDYEDPKGNKDARSHIYKLRQTKAAVEKTRKKEKAESLEYGRQVDSQAKEIMAAIEALIDVHAKPLEEIEQREADRVARLRANLDEIAGAGTAAAEGWHEIPLQTMKDRLAEVEAESTDDDVWQEFALDAARAKDASMSLLREAISKRETRDAEQAELDRLRAENEAREAAEREADIRRKEAALAEKRAEEQAAVERKRVEEERERAAAEATRREAELKLQAERAERQKAEAETRAANAAKEAQERLERETAETKAREAAEVAAREADKKHRGGINRAAAAALVKGGLTQDSAKTAVTLIASKTVPAVTISY